jgi:hypothetical protein
MYAEGTPLERKHRYFVREPTAEAAVEAMQERFPEDESFDVDEWPAHMTPHTVLTYDASDRNEFQESECSQLQCSRCVAEGERVSSVSPKVWSRLTVSIRHDGGIQVWCTRHNINVAEIALSIGLPPETSAETVH